MKHTTPKMKTLGLLFPVFLSTTIEYLQFKNTFTVFIILTMCLSQGRIFINIQVSKPLPLCACK